MDNKKIAAAVAAVFTYIKTQEEAVYYYSSQMENGNQVEIPIEEIVKERTIRFSAWANAGRLSQIQQNSMMLMKGK